MDNWKHRSAKMKCATCMYFVEKILSKPYPTEESPRVGRCRRNAPTMKGWPVLFDTDWCGEHKLDEEKIYS